MKGSIFSFFPPESLGSQMKSMGDQNASVQGLNQQIQIYHPRTLSKMSGNEISSAVPAPKTPSKKNDSNMIARIQNMMHHQKLESRSEQRAGRGNSLSAFNDSKLNFPESTDRNVEEPDEAAQGVTPRKVPYYFQNQPLETLREQTEDNLQTLTTPRIDYSNNNYLRQNDSKIMVPLMLRDETLQEDTSVRVSHIEIMQAMQNSDDDIEMGVNCNLSQINLQEEQATAEKEQEKELRNPDTQQQPSGDPTTEDQEAMKVELDEDVTLSARRVPTEKASQGMSLKSKAKTSVSRKLSNSVSKQEATSYVSQTVGKYSQFQEELKKVNNIYLDDFEQPKCELFKDMVFDDNQVPDKSVSQMFSPSSPSAIIKKSIPIFSVAEENNDADQSEGENQIQPIKDKFLITKLEDWITQRLRPDEVQQAQKRIDEMYPLKNLPLENLFPVLQIFQYTDIEKEDEKMLEEMKKQAEAKEHEKKGEGAPCTKPHVASAAILGCLSKKMQMYVKRKTQLATESDRLEQYLKHFRTSYEGTDPISDAEKVNLQTKLKMTRSSQALGPANVQKGDLFDVFGHGIKSYFFMLTQLIHAYLFLTVLFVILIFIYRFSNTDSDQLISMGQLTLGNLMHPEFLCKHQFISIKKPLQLECHVGKINQLKYYGITPYHEEAEQEDEDHVDFYDYCGDQNAVPGVKKCDSSSLDSNGLQAYFVENCKGKTECEFEIDQFKSKVSDESRAECYNQYAVFYLQWDCTMQATNMRTGLGIALIGSISCLFFTYLIYYLKCSAELNYDFWDSLTITTSDFTCQVKFPEAVWLNWIEKVKNEKISRDGFKEYFQNEIERQVNDLPFTSKDITVRVSSIFLAYDNQDLLLALTERGKMLSSGEIDENSRMEERITGMIETNEEKYQRPVAAFVTFAQQEGLDRVDRYLNAGYNFVGKLQLNPSGISLTFLNEKLSIIRAPEPSNVVWENLGFTQKQILKNSLCVQVVITVFLVIVFVGVLFLNNSRQGYQKKYPHKHIHYDQLNRLFDSEEQFKKYALHDKTMTLKEHGIGIYQGYCEQHNSWYSDYRDDDAICHQYVYDTVYEFLGKNVTTGLIVLIDQMLIFLNILLVERIGFGTQEIIVRTICMSIFYSQYFNTGLLLLISNANLEYSALSFTQLKGRYADFDNRWYQDLGPQLVQTMLIKSFMPYVQLIMLKLQMSLTRYMDRGSFSESDDTKKVTIQQYIECYAGPELQLHFRYATIMNYIFVSFTYGLILPLLFPITLIALANLYVVERYQFAYIYRKPPIMGNDLNRKALETMKWAPVVMLIFGYWQLGNRQIFFDEKILFQYLSEISDPKHRLFDYSKGPDHTILLLIFLPIFVFQSKFIKTIQRMGTKLKVFPPSVLDKYFDDSWNFVGNFQEESGDYFQSIKGQDQKRWFTQELYNRNELNIKTMTDSSFEELRTAKRADQYLMNIYNYDILSNFRYCDRLFYSHLDIRVESESSDFIQKVLNIGEARYNDGDKSEQL